MSNSSIIEELLTAYAIPKERAAVRAYGNGHINDTFLVETEIDGVRERKILQMVNQGVFHHPDQVMENIAGVTAWLRRKILAAGGDPERETLNILPASDGALYYRDSAGEYWRMFAFIGDTYCPERIESAALFRECGAAFGHFQAMLSDYPAETLYETIIDFHNTPVRYRTFLETVASDPMGRAAGASGEIAFVNARAGFVSSLTDRIADGTLPLRVTHNDTKLNNILMDNATGKAVCVIDLDTVMPGLTAYDFGDAIRYGGTTASEDEPDLSKVQFELELFRAYTEGFAETCGSSLTDAEWDSLVDGCLMITLECGLRFLADHIDGDHYFKIHRPGQNLDRARVQFKLVSDMERARAEMEAVIREMKSKARR